MLPPPPHRSSLAHNLATKLDGYSPCLVFQFSLGPQNVLQVPVSGILPFEKEV